MVVMSEPSAVAQGVEEVVPGVWRWWVSDERIGGLESDAHAVEVEGGVVLVDPLPLTGDALASLGTVVAIVLTAACHQRSAWRLRAALGVPVHLPEGSRETDEEPDARYREGDLLPGGLRAIRTPGPEEPHYALHLDRSGGVIFVADLLMRLPDGRLAVVPAQYHEDPEATLASLRRLLDEPFGVMCMSHGAPEVGDPHRALRDLLGGA
jgi:hypothetical protein